MPVGPDVLLALTHHLTPRGRGRVDPDADEGQRRLGEDRLRDAERDRDHDRRERVGQDVAREQAAEAGAEGAGPVDELLFLDRQHLRARLAGNPHPAGEADRDKDIREAGAQHRHDQDHEQEARERVHDVDEAREEQVGTAAQITGQRADRHADQHDDHLGAEPDEHRHPRAVDHAGEKIAAELIGPQGVVTRGHLVEAPEVRLGVRERGEQVGEDRDQAQQHDDGSAGHRQAIAQEPARAVAPEGRRANRRLTGRRRARARASPAQSVLGGGIGRGAKPPSEFNTGCGGRGRHTGGRRRGS